MRPSLLSVVLLVALALASPACRGSNKADRHYNLAVQLHQQGRFEQAIAEYDQAIRIDPRLAVAYVNRGGAFNELGEYQRAVRDETQAILVDSKLAAAYDIRGLAYYSLGQYWLAIQDLTEAIRLEPQLTGAYINRALAYANLGQPHRAIQDYDEAIRLEPRPALAYNNRGSAFHILSQYQRALEDYTQAIRFAPELALAYHNRGLAYMSLGQAGRAIQDLSEAIRLDPQLALAYHNRALAYMSLDQRQRAAADLEEIARLNPVLAASFSAGLSEQSQPVTAANLPLTSTSATVSSSAIGAPVVATAGSTPLPAIVASSSPSPTATPVPTPTYTAVPTASPTSTPIPASAAVPTPAATATPFPTSTPAPAATATRLPTSTPTPTATATPTPPPTATPTPTPLPRPIILTGTGQRFSSKFYLDIGLTVIRMEHEGQSNFAVSLLDNQGLNVEKLVDGWGSFVGSTAIGVNRAGAYMLDVLADGQWMIEVDQTSPAMELEPTIALFGHGRQASPFFNLDSALTVVRMQHDGQSNFAIALLDSQGKQVASLANVMGIFDGSSAIGVESPGTYILDIAADGNWTVNITQPAPVTQLEPPIALSGSGIQASPFFNLAAGLVVVRMEHDGQSDFVVRLLDSLGNAISVLVDEAGPFDGSTAIGVPQTGTYMLDISADGNWTVEIERQLTD